MQPSEHNEMSLAKYETAFGDLSVKESVEIVALKFAYGVLDDCETFTYGGTVTTVGSEVKLTSGTSAGNYSTIWSRRPGVYVPGLGMQAKGTARFDSPVADYIQYHGFYSAVDGLIVGYNTNKKFGCMHRHAGEFEVRTLTLTTPAGGAETVSVTVNGATVSGIAVTGTSAEQDAHEIEQALMADPVVGASWRMQHVGTTIVMAYRGDGLQDGTYSISSSGALVGSWAQNNAGADATEDWYYLDPPTGENGVNGDPEAKQWLLNEGRAQSGNIYRFTYAFLGYGPLRWEVMTDTGWKTIHMVKWQGKNQSTNMGNPSLRIAWSSASITGTGSDVTMYGGSGSIDIQGNRTRGRPSAFVASKSHSNSETYLGQIKIRYELNGRSCNAIAVPTLYCQTNGSKGAVFRVYLNADEVSSPITAHQYIDEDQSIVLGDTSGGIDTATGRFLGAFPVGPNGSIRITEADIKTVLAAGDSLSVTAKMNTAGADTSTATFNLEEII